MERPNTGRHEKAPVRCPYSRLAALHGAPRTRVCGCSMQIECTMDPTSLQTRTGRKGVTIRTCGSPLPWQQSDGYDSQMAGDILGSQANTRHYEGPTITDEHSPSQLIVGPS